LQHFPAAWVRRKAAGRLRADWTADGGTPQGCGQRCSIVVHFVPMQAHQANGHYVRGCHFLLMS